VYERNEKLRLNEYERKYEVGVRFEGVWEEGIWIGEKERKEYEREAVEVGGVQYG
jgi:hypothetical protein